MKKKIAVVHIITALSFSSLAGCGAQAVQVEDNESAIEQEEILEVSEEIGVTYEDEPKDAIEEQGVEAYRLVKKFIKKSKTENGEVKESEEDYTYEYDENGYNNHVIEYELFYEGTDGTSEYFYEYDSNGNPIKFVEDLLGFFGGTTEYEYDENGHMIKLLYYSSFDDGDLTYYTDYEYDDNGNLIKEISYHFPDDSIREHYEYEYDSEGFLIRKKEFNPWDDVHLMDPVSEYFYDDNGNETKMVAYGVSVYNEILYDDILFVIDKEYDGSGKIIRETYQLYGEYEDWYTIEYEYDDNGNLIRETKESHEEFFEGFLDLITITEYEYETYFE